MTKSLTHKIFFIDIIIKIINLYLFDQVSYFIDQVCLFPNSIWAATCDFQQCGILTSVD